MIKRNNKIILYDNYAEIILVDKNNNEKGRAIVDLEDTEKIKFYSWHLKNGNYVATAIGGRLNRKRLYLHRVIMDIIDKPSIIIDHIDRNPLNNRKSNLRLGTSIDNSRNLSTLHKSSSGINGVHWNKTRNQWVLNIMFKYEHIHIIRTRDKKLAIQIKKDFNELFEKRSNNGLYSHLPISVAYDVKNEVLKKYMIELKLDKIKNKIYFDDNNIFDSIIEYIPLDSKIWIHNNYLNLVNIIKEKYKYINITQDDGFNNFLFIQKPHMVNFIICWTRFRIMDYIKRCRMFKVPFVVLISKEDITEDLKLPDIDRLLCIVHNNYIWYIVG